MKRSILFIGLNGRGGMAHYTHEFCSSLVSLGHDVTMVCLGSFEVPTRFRSYRVVEVQANIGPKRFAYVLSIVKSLVVSLRLTKKLLPDAIFFNVYQPLMGWPFACLRPRRSPLFCIQHEVEPRMMPRHISMLQRDFYRKCTAIVVHRHTHSRDLLVQKYRIKVPILSIDFGLYQTDLFGKESISLEGTKSTILSFGSIRPDKGLDLLVKAYPGREKCLGLRLVIAGQAKKSYGKYFSSLVANRDDVTWDRNYVPLEDTAKLYRDAAFVVLPFRECTQTASMRLAMFFEIPIIASAVGEIPWFIETYKVGMLVPRGDIGALGEAITMMASNSAARDSYIENIRRLRQCPELSWKRIVMGLLQDLDERRLW